MVHFICGLKFIYYVHKNGHRTAVSHKIFNHQVTLSSSNSNNNNNNNNNNKYTATTNNNYK